MPAGGDAFDPDQYRMTVGEHLEELRRRILLGLAGFVVALGVCLLFARSHVIPFFCAPLFDTLTAQGINPQLVFDDVSEGFMVFMRISVISAIAMASPWLAYQLWQFVAAGLYPAERKYVTRYLPLSIALLMGGLAMVYYVVLPWTLQFLIAFGAGIPQPGPAQTTASTQPAAMIIPRMAGNPPEPVEAQFWFDTAQQRLKFFLGGQVRVVSFGSDELLRPEISLDKYIRFVVSMLLAFGVAFQMPLAVLALERIGIIDVKSLRRARRHAYFVLTILAACITPGGDLPSLVALVVPLVLLYELGIWLAGRGAATRSR